MEMNPDLMAPYGGTLVMVVEYLESTMSKDLLCKFPDNSAYDFDYSQSSIWSPLIHRPFPSTSSTPISTARRNILSCGLSRKLKYDNDKGLTKIKKVTAKIRRKFADAVLCNLQKHQKMKKRNKRRNSSLDFSPLPSSNKLPSTSSPTPRKGWLKVLKAASKHFKKKNKKKDSIGQLNFSSYLTGGD